MAQKGCVPPTGALGAARHRLLPFHHVRSFHNPGRAAWIRIKLQVVSLVPLLAERQRPRLKATGKALAIPANGVLGILLDRDQEQMKQAQPEPHPGVKPTAEPTVWPSPPPECREWHFLFRCSQQTRAILTHSTDENKEACLQWPRQEKGAVPPEPRSAESLAFCPDTHSGCPWATQRHATPWLTFQK